MIFVGITDIIHLEIISLPYSHRWPPIDRHTSFVRSNKHFSLAEDNFRSNMMWMASSSPSLCIILLCVLVLGQDPGSGVLYAKAYQYPYPYQHHLSSTRIQNINNKKTRFYYYRSNAVVPHPKTSRIVKPTSLSMMSQLPFSLFQLPATPTTTVSFLTGTLLRKGNCSSFEVFLKV